MKVVHVDTGMEWRGGQSQVLLLAQGLMNYDCNTMIIAKEGSRLLERAVAEGVPARGLPLRFEADLSSAHALSEIAGSEADTLFHAHTPHAFGLALLARGLSRKPLVLFTRRVAFPIKKNIASRWKLKQADQIVAVSQAAAREISLAGIEPDRIRIIHSGVDLEKFVYHGPSMQKPFSVAIIGTIESQKGLQEAMEFISNFDADPVAFHFFGGGPDLGQLQQYAASRTNVLVHGFVEDLAPFLTRMFALLSFSPLEGFPNSVLQGMAVGLPVLARENSGTREMIPANDYGYLFDSLAGAISTLHSMLRDPDEQIRTGKRASEWVRSQFSKEEMVRKNYDLYKELLK